MAEYKVGALSMLISEKPNDEIDDLFKPVRKSPPKTAHTEVPRVEPTQEDKPKKKKVKPAKKKKPDNDNSDSEEEPEAPQFSQPSRRFQVLHEEENRSKGRDPEMEKRTIFVGNLPIKADKKAVKKFFDTFGPIDTIRFRGAARPDMQTTKKQAIIQKKFHEKRHNIIAFVRFEDEDSAQKSLAMNGEKFLDHVIRVDLASNCNKDPTSSLDQSKAIFVGNLGFALEEDEVREHFERCGKIVNVRIVRDPQTGIGKGFCYVNFEKKESVATAIDLLNGTTLANRELRVTKSVNRAKKTLKTVDNLKSKTPFATKKPELKKKLKDRSAKIKKVNKKEMKISFEGSKAEKHRKVVADKKVPKKKLSQGERKRKVISKKLQHVTNKK